jgi:hypothetical protein
MHDMGKTLKAILAAIVKDDRAEVKALLAANEGLAARGLDAARLYKGAILHWMYVGDTALHLAAAGYRTAIVRLLLAAGANPNAAFNHRRGRPLHYAADGYIIGPAWNEKAQLETIRLLLDAGAEIEAADKNGATALHRAVRTRCAAAVRCLLDAGANPLVKNKSGSTPFHLAVQNTGRGGSGAAGAVAAQRLIIEEFLKRGISTSIKDGSGRSVRSCAKTGWVEDMLGAHGEIHR